MIAVDAQTIGFPHVETVIKVQRRSTETKKNEISHYVSSIAMGTCSPRKWMDLIRGHWGGIEIRNHWRKDACLFEDKTCSRNPNIVAAFAMLRNLVLFFLQEQQIHSTITGFVEATAADASKAYAMIKAAK